MRQRPSITWPVIGRLGRLVLGLVAAFFLVAGCNGSPTSPSPERNPTSVGSQVVIGTILPAAGATVVATGNPPGAFLARGSGAVSIPVTVSSDRDLPWAQLSVYLLTVGDYCGQNLPDAPVWTPLPANRPTPVTISGFQVYRLPCAVTGVRAMLHTRTNGLLMPPTAGETIAEATVSASFFIW